MDMNEDDQIRMNKAQLRDALVDAQRQIGILKATLTKTLNLAGIKLPDYPIAEAEVWRQAYVEWVVVPKHWRRS